MKKKTGKKPAKKAHPKISAEVLEVRARPCSKSQRGHSVTRCGNIPRWYRADSFGCFPGRAHRQCEAFPRRQGKSMRLGFVFFVPRTLGRTWGTPDSAPRQAEGFDLDNFGHLRWDHTFVDDMWRELFGFYLYCRMAARRKGRGSPARMRLCNIRSQQPVELLQVVRIRGDSHDAHAARGCLPNLCLRG